MAARRRGAGRASDAGLRALRAFGLAYPHAHTKSPWPGHLDLAVNDKTFAYLSLEGEPFSISCKLPKSAGAALMLPFAQPTPYGLGKSGWVTVKFPEGKPLPLDILKAWIDESYRAQAPKRLAAQLGPRPGDVPLDAVPKRAAPGRARP
ncbi:MAG TPA: MmcQ/YjbR family DNA-binding protein, partial [Candidatus Polarisedimenticolia bacterium]|nr:MmcQ/YjbR family DNA-binding protein [Candidatus Polarisedimenticolia bacterium]